MAWRGVRFCGLPPLLTDYLAAKGFAAHQNSECEVLINTHTTSLCFVVVNAIYTDILKPFIRLVHGLVCHFRDQLLVRLFKDG